MGIIRIFDPNRPKFIFDEDILRYGFEKAYILGGIEHAINGDGSRPSRRELYRFFRALSQERFNNLLCELIECGALSEGGSNE